MKERHQPAESNGWNASFERDGALTSGKQRRVASAQTVGERENQSCQPGA
jgi:hypothetical protein